MIATRRLFEFDHVGFDRSRARIKAYPFEDVSSALSVSQRGRPVGYGMARMATRQLTAPVQGPRIRVRDKTIVRQRKNPALEHEDIWSPLPQGPVPEQKYHYKSALDGPEHRSNTTAQSALYMSEYQRHFATLSSPSPAPATRTPNSTHTPHGTNKLPSLSATTKARQTPTKKSTQSTRTRAPGSWTRIGYNSSRPSLLVLPRDAPHSTATPWQMRDPGRVEYRRAQTAP